MAGIIKQQPGQQMIGFVAYGGAVRPLLEGFLPDRITLYPGVIAKATLDRLS